MSPDGQDTYNGSVATNTDCTNPERNPKRCTNTEALGLSRHNCGPQSGNVEPTLSFTIRYSTEASLQQTATELGHSSSATTSCRPMARTPTPDRSQPKPIAPTKYTGNRGIIRDRDRNGKWIMEKGEPPSAKDSVGWSRRECILKDRIQPRRNQTLATRATFTDTSVNGLSYISPGRGHYSSSRPQILNLI